jgi:predicted dehydrogenase
MPPIRVGLVGCGEIAQIMHLPFLSQLDQFEIAAVCDLSPTVLDAMGDRYGVAARYTDYRELVAQPDLDVVAILTMDHYPAARGAIGAGKHVFVEKPLAFSREEAQELVDEADRASVLLMVGYMKVYDPGFEYAAARIAAMRDVRQVHLQDLTGVFDAHHPLYSLVRATDLPAGAAEEQAARILASIEATLGPDAAHQAVLLRKLLMLCSHDFAVLRTAIGPANQVLFSDLTPDWGITAVLDHGQGQRCVFEGGSWPKYSWFHEQLRAYGRDEILTLSFAPPFTHHVPSTVRIELSDEGRHVKHDVVVSHEPAFKREWLHFASCIEHNRAPRTDGRGAVQDIDLAIEIVRSLPS